MMDQTAAQAIRNVISLEAMNDPSRDGEIADLSLSTIRYIDEHLIEIDERLEHFLHDFDVRRKDQKYSVWQTLEALGALED